MTRPGWYFMTPITFPVMRLTSNAKAVTEPTRREMSSREQPRAPARTPSPSLTLRQVSTLSCPTTTFPSFSAGRCSRMILSHVGRRGFVASTNDSRLCGSQRDQESTAHDDFPAGDKVAGIIGDLPGKNSAGSWCPTTLRQVSVV